MKKIMLILTAAVGLTMTAFAQSFQYDPYKGPYGGFRDQNGNGGQFDPYYGPNGGIRFDHGGGYQYDPYYGPNGGWRYQRN